MHSLPRFPCVRLPASLTLSPAGRSLLIQYSQVEIHLCSCCVTPGSCLSWVSVARDAGHTLALTSTQLWSSGSSPTSRCFFQPGSSTALQQAPAFSTFCVQKQDVSSASQVVFHVPSSVRGLSMWHLCLYKMLSTFTTVPHASCHYHIAGFCSGYKSSVSDIYSYTHASNYLSLASMPS